MEQATTLFGYFAGMGLPLVMLATIPTASLAASIVPAVSEAHALQNFEGIRQKITYGHSLVPSADFSGGNRPGSFWQSLFSQLLYGTKAAAALHCTPGTGNLSFGFTSDYDGYAAG